MEMKRLMAAIIVGIMIVSGLGIVSVGAAPKTQDVLSTPEPVQPRGTVPRVSLAEDFTGWNCAPCASHNPAWTAAINAVGYTKVAPAYTHVWWPTAADDPMYMYCEGITGPQGDDNSVTSRVQTHGVGWAPWACVDGTQVATGETQANYEAMFNAAAAIPARVAITTSGWVDTGGMTATLSANAEVVEDLEPGNYRLMMYLWEGPVTGVGSGTNGETVFDWAVWRMLPNGMGTDLGWSSGAHEGDSMSVSYTVPIEASWDVAELGGTIFVQNFDTLAVEQAAVELFAAPQVTLTSPDPDVSEQLLNGNVNIDWIAHDTQDADNTLDIAIDYSIDGGNTWFPIMSGTNNNNPPYVWNTALYPDSPHYELRISATDTSANTGINIPSAQDFSIDNTINDRWYLQTENVNLAGNLDLDMKPSENLIWNYWNREKAPGETFTDISGPGEFPIQTFASNPITGDAYDIGGAWTFSISAKAGYSNPVPNGNLYANVYAHDGLSSRLLDTTVYDDENVGSFSSYHTFTWTDTLLSNIVFEGERVIVEIVFHATSGSPTALFSNYARSGAKVMGTVTNNYNNTMSSNVLDESIQEITNYQTRYIDQTFVSATFPPTGWQVATSGTTGTWSRQGSNTAGGIKPEARFLYGASGTGTSRLYTGPINTAGETSLDLAFDTFFDAYATGVTVKAQTSTDGNTWVDTGWQIVGGTTNFGPSRVTEVLTAADNIGSSTLYVAFVVDGNSYNLDYWFVDDVILGRDITSMLEYKWMVKVPVGDSPYQFNLEASRVPGTDTDNFQFAYSTDDVSYTNMVIVNSAADATYTYGLPAVLPEDVYIKVTDTVRTVGSNSLSQIDVDHMYISSTSNSQIIMGYDQVMAPSYVIPYLGTILDDKPVVNILTPASGTSDQIISGSPYMITWTATDTEDVDATLDIKIEYSDNGGVGWIVLEDGIDNNDGVYSWNIGALSDNVNYKVKVTATDSIPHKGSDTTLAFSIDNTLNDRWFLQVQTTGPNNRLNMLPVDIGPYSNTTGTISTVGQQLVGTWQTDAITGTSIDGAWAFNLYGMASANIGTGYLYAKVFSSTGPTLLDITVNDDENVFPYTSQHLFTWTDTLAGAFTAGDSLLVEVWVNATNVQTFETLNTIGTTQAGGPHNVWFCDVNGNTQAELTTPGGGSGEMEFTDTDYTGAGTSNDIRAGPSINPGVGDKIFVKASFATSADPAWISAMKFTYEAQYSAANTIVYIYAWNTVTSFWDQVGTTLTFTTANTDYTMVRSIASNWDDYISGGILLWGAYGSTRTTCSVDLLEVQMTFSPSATVSLNFDYVGSESYIDPTLGGGAAPISYDIDLTGRVAGDWAFVSFPIAISGNIETILDDPATDWDVAKWFDGSSQRWMTYRKGATTNTFTNIDNQMGVWVHLTAVVGDKLTTGLGGAYPSSQVNITLYAGWNMVGYPSQTPMAANLALAGTGATIVSTYISSSPFIQDFTDLSLVTMSHGNAYWVFVPATIVWNVPFP
ncbi:MAG: hypothetical protein FP824_09600 [Euryarchaeota archaeon]|nr:hypothetical protein [Euryarchaeota archaeon]